MIENSIAKNDSAYLFAACQDRFNKSENFPFSKQEWVNGCSTGLLLLFSHASGNLEHLTAAYIYTFSDIKL
jgi:hypothetical protein